MRPLVVLSGDTRVRPVDAAELADIDLVLARIEQRLRHRAYPRVRRAPGCLRFEARAMHRRGTMKVLPPEVVFGRVEITAERDGDAVHLHWRWDATAGVLLFALFGLLGSCTWGLAAAFSGLPGLLPVPLVLGLGVGAMSVVIGRGPVRRLIVEFAKPVER